LQSGTVTVVFMGSPGFAVPTLELLHASGRFDVVLAVTQPDKPQGRGRKMAPTPVRHAAEALGVPVVIKATGGYGELRDRLLLLKPDFIVVVAFGLILKQDILDLPRYGCINLHASLLPRHRGVSPIPAALLSGDEVTGCTSMFMDQGIDTGPILGARETTILPTDTAGSLSARLAELGARLMVETLEGIVEGALKASAQDESKATHTRKLKKDDGLIRWDATASHIERLVRAMQPWPTAYTFCAGKRLIVLRAQARAGERSTRTPGTVVSIDPLRVSCGEGLLEIEELKVQGKGARRAKEFVSGYHVAAGDLLASDDAVDDR
jgi:methionyl-tRNA formyltransferase